MPLWEQIPEEPPFAQPQPMSALPTLYAATASHVQGGQYFGAIFAKRKNEPKNLRAQHSPGYAKPPGYRRGGGAALPYGVRLFPGGLFSQCETSRPPINEQP